MSNYIYSPCGELARAIESALGLGLTEEEWLAASCALCNLTAEDETVGPDQIVIAFEKAIGLGLDQSDFQAATASVRRLLEQYKQEETQAFGSAPDAYLEMAYEDRVSGLDPDS
jgi:hypothetical protein